MKMGVWLFSTSMEERRQRPFILTLTDWRKRTTIHPPTDTTPANIEPGPDGYINAPLGRLIFTIIKYQLALDIIDFTLKYGDSQLPIHVLSALLSNICSLLGQTGKAATLAPAGPLTYSTIIVSTFMCALFCVYIQMQLQVIYDAFMIVYTIIYKILPTLEKWHFGEDSKNIVKTKAISRRLGYIRAIKSHIEDTISMQPLFDSPWTAHSLRGFWGRRWHTFYTDCFYRLGYKPTRWAVQLLFNCRLPRWLPALSVFVMSGIMHEYFLFAATGSSLYFGSPLAACGLQVLFFIVQVFLISTVDNLFNRGIVGQLYTVFCVAVTSHLIVVPYLLTGFLYTEHFSFYRIAVDLYKYFC